jgi:N-acyl-L-homoserine lactone synthetase
MKRMVRGAAGDVACGYDVRRERAAPMTEPVGVLDGLVERVLSTYPYRFTVPATEAENAVGYRIRADAAAAAGWSTNANVPGLERDDFDTAAVHILGWDGDEAVCTGRLVLPPGPLPTEQVCGLVVEPAGQVVDVGRMAVARSHQSTEHAVFIALLCRLYLEMRSRGYEVACGMMSRPARRLVRLLGVELDELEPEREYWGELRAPVRFVLTTNSASISRRWEPSPPTTH